MSTEVSIAVLASGGGTNLQALIDADLHPGRLRVVIVNVPGARALERAERAGIEPLLIDHKAFSDRDAFDAEVVAQLKARNIDWVVLAGFMRIVGRHFLETFENRIVNIHPSLLPAFPGVRAQAQALKAGVKVTGCTVHLVDAGMDTGPILAQAVVPVLPNDDDKTLSRRILAEEHRLFPAVVRALSLDRLRKHESGRFYLDVPNTSPGPLLSPGFES